MAGVRAHGPWRPPGLLPDCASVLFQAIGCAHATPKDLAYIDQASLERALRAARGREGRAIATVRKSKLRQAHAQVKNVYTLTTPPPAGDQLAGINLCRAALGAAPGQGPSTSSSPT